MPLLSICIPTFNRASFVDRQLASLKPLLEPHRNDCELVVSDNASPDDTPAVCRKWAEAFQGRLIVYRQPQNLGLIGNCEFCLRHATGRYVWLVGDDDPLDPDAVQYVLDVLRNSPDIGLLHLNHRCLAQNEKTVIFPRFYPWESDQHDEPGIRLFERALQHRVGGQYFITACVVNRQFATEAANRWPRGTANLTWPMYIYAYAAAKGAMRISGRVFIDCIYTRSSWARRAAIVFYHDENQVFLKMADFGYDPAVLRRVGMKRITSMSVRDVASLIKRLVLPHPLLFLEALTIFARLTLRRKPRPLPR